MNNRNWIAVFLGLAVLVLFVSVMGSTNNWLNSNNGENNGMNPQQINQTVRGMDNNTVPNQDFPTKIDANGITDSMTGNGQDNTNNTTNTNDTPNNGADDKNALDVPQINMPMLNQ